MHQITEEHYAHQIEVKLECSDPEAEIVLIPIPVYAEIVNALVNNIRKGTFGGEDCCEYPDVEEKEKIYYSGSWQILEVLPDKSL